MKPPAYAAVGSRETPEEYADDLARVVLIMSIAGFVMRSGGAYGADTMFENAANGIAAPKEIFLPWDNFNNRTIDKDHFVMPYNHEANRIAKNYHPMFYRMGEITAKLIIRNGYQVCGRELNDPVKFVVCYTKAALPVGGTGQAIRIATALGIPIFNFGNFDGVHKEFPLELRIWQFREFLKPILEDNQTREG